jgi:hypothetical protein
MLLNSYITFRIILRKDSKMLYNIILKNNFVKIFLAKLFLRLVEDIFVVFGPKKFSNENGGKRWLAWRPNSGWLYKNTNNNFPIIFSQFRK